VRFQVTTMIRKLYFECLAADQALATAEQLNGIAAKFLDMSQKRHEIAKTLAEASVLQSEIESESTDLLVEQATQRRDAARRRLAAAIGGQNELPGNLEDVFARELPDLDFDTIRDRILQDSPALAELRFAVDRARWAVERASAGRVPNLNVQTGVQFDNATQDTIANVQVSLPIPVRDRNQGAIAEACARLTAAQAALEARELGVQQQLVTTLRDYNTARERMKRYTDKIKAAAEKSLKYTNLGFEGNQIDYAQAYNVQQTYSAKSLSYVQDLETAWQQWAEIDGFLLGEMTANGIDPVSRTSENGEDERY
jgi:outer membrane protein, heavy metal efflux system